MSAVEQATAPAPAAVAPPAAAEPSLLDQILSATRQTERSRAHDLIRALTDEALKGVVTYDKNVTQTLKGAMQAIDEALSKQVAAILHHPDLQKLEGTWRGMHHLVMN